MSATNIGLSLVVLRNVPLFAELNEAELEKVSKVSVRKRVERSAFVVRAGDSTDSLYILLTGRAKVTNHDEEGKEIILAWLGPGEFFGEMGLIDGSPRSANVVAARALRVIGAEQGSFPALFAGQLPGGAEVDADSGASSARG
jgi:CRP/FNR family cyclic AMP-dependent transcriptional regulator